MENDTKAAIMRDARALLQKVSHLPNVAANTLLVDGRNPFDPMGRRAMLELLPTYTYTLATFMNMLYDHCQPSLLVPTAIAF